MVYVLDLNLSAINPWAVVVAGLVHMVIGLIWFRPKLFGNAWTRLTGKQMNPAPKWMVAGLFGHLAIAFVLAEFVLLAGATTAIEGAFVGILVWIGFFVTLELGEIIWEKIPLQLFAIRIGDHLVGLSLAGAVLAVWR